MENFYIAFYVPGVIIFLLFLMTYFSRKNKIKYLYLTNIVFLGIVIGSNFIVMNSPIGYNGPKILIFAMPFIWVISWVVSFFLTIVSISIFLIMNAKKYLWAKAAIIILIILSIIALVWFGYLFILGILSLKSG